MTRALLNIFFSLIRNELMGTPMPNSIRLADGELREVLELAKNHCVEQLVADSAVRNGLIDDPKLVLTYQKTQLKVVCAVAGIDEEQKKLTRIFEEKEIEYVLLKGCIMRELYPERWMRSSCDIDILVHEEAREKAISALTEMLDYTVKGEKHHHDTDLYSAYGIHLELHHSILSRISKIDRVLKTVWENVAAIDGSSYGYKETPEFFVFHILAHMYAHLLSGGCGIRPFIDLWIIENKLEYDRNKLNELLKESDLVKFHDIVNRLASCWMNGEALTPAEAALEEYIINGKAYGTRKNEIALVNNISGGKKSYIFRRIFAPYKVLEEKYPWLKGKHYLAPIAQIMRWLTLLRRRKRTKVKRELKTLRAISEEREESVTALLNEAGIDIIKKYPRGE